MSPRALLENLGLSNAAALLYEVVLDLPQGTAATYASAVPALGLTAVQTAMAELCERGFATQGPDERFAAVPPAVAIPSAVLLRAEQSALVTTAEPSLTSRFWAARALDQPDLIEVVHNRDEGFARWLQLDRLVQHRIRAFDRPPYITSLIAINPFEVAGLARGVRHQIVYSTDALSIPGRWPTLLAELAAGEEARVTAELPAKLTLFDDFAAIISLAGETPDQSTPVLMIVHESQLLDSLSLLFNVVWQQSQPLDDGRPTSAASAPQEPTPKADDLELRRMFAAGLSDDAIQRELGVSASTVQRRVRRLLDAVGARSRFQAGYALGAQVAGRGLPTDR